MESESDRYIYYPVDACTAATETAYNNNNNIIDRCPLLLRLPQQHISAYVELTLVVGVVVVIVTSVRSVCGQLTLEVFTSHKLPVSLWKSTTTTTTTTHHRAGVKLGPTKMAG